MHVSKEYSWDEIQPTAKRLFFEMNGQSYYVWQNPFELTWAEKSWYALRQSGLTTYISGSDKVLVETQILVLAAMFCKFMEFYCNKPILIDYSEWFIEMNLDIFQLENALGKKLAIEYREKEVCRESVFDYEEEDSFDCEATIIYSDDGDDTEIAAKAVEELIKYHKQAVYHALVATFGSKELLYHSLLRTQEQKDCRRWIEEGMPLEKEQKKMM